MMTLEVDTGAEKLKAAATKFLNDFVKKIAAAESMASKVAVCIDLATDVTDAKLVAYICKKEVDGWFKRCNSDTALAIFSLSLAAMRLLKEPEALDYLEALRNSGPVFVDRCFNALLLVIYKGSLSYTDCDRLAVMLDF